MKAYLTSLHLPAIRTHRAFAPVTVDVETPTPEAAHTLADAAREAGIRVVPNSTAYTVPAVVAAIVLGGLFAVIGLQGINAVLGLPRVDTVFDVPASAIGAAFTFVGLALGTLAGTLIAHEPIFDRNCRVRLRGDRREIIRLTRAHEAELR